MFNSTSGFARAYACLAAAFLLIVCRMPLQAQSVTGAIQGTVVDQSGAVLPGVTVTVTNTRHRRVRTIVTDATGTFRAELLPVGPYDVLGGTAGFAPAEAERTSSVTVGSIADLADRDARRRAWPNRSP